MARSNEPTTDERAMPVTWTMTRRVLGKQAEHEIDFQPAPSELEEIAAFLRVEELAQWRIKGRLVAEPDDVWRLEARMTARLTQACVISLEPVPQKVDERLRRIFVPEETLEQASELDLDPDAEDETEPYGPSIDLGAVALEALALALDPYPRKADAGAESLVATPPGAEPLTDEALKPFAKLAALREKMEDGSGEPG